MRTWAGILKELEALTEANDTYANHAGVLGYRGTEEQLKHVGMAIELGFLAWHNKEPYAVEQFENEAACIWAYAGGTANQLGIED